MANICKECDDGRWECGEEQELCGDFGDWVRKGDAFIPVGVGNMVVVLTVYAKIIETQDDDGNVVRECLVRLDKFCPKHCKRQLVAELT